MPSSTVPQRQCVAWLSSTVCNWLPTCTFRVSLFHYKHPDPCAAAAQTLKVCSSGWRVSDNISFLATGFGSRGDNNFFAVHNFSLLYGWMTQCMDGCVDGGIHRRSRGLFGCSRWRSSRCRGGEGLRFPSSAFHYDAPWQRREWMCGRMYSLPISTSSAQAASTPGSSPSQGK